MLIKIWCFLFGHKFMIKAMTGQQYDTHHKLYPDITIKGNYYKWQRLEYCKRCGEKFKSTIKTRT